jgi:hypothetical protein
LRAFHRVRDWEAISTAHEVIAVAALPSRRSAEVFVQPSHRVVVLVDQRGH